MKIFIAILGIVGSIASIISVFGVTIKWSESMESIQSLLDHLTFWPSALIVSLLITLVSFVLWLLLTKKYQNREFRLSTKMEIVKDGEKYYLVKGSICSYIPDEPTFNYLGDFFGFSWGDAKLMSFDDIQQKYKMGKHLSSIRSYCSNHDI